VTTNFPAALDNFTNPAGNQSQNVSRTHSQQHGDLNDAVEAVQAAIGITGSADTNSLTYKVGAITGSNGAGLINYADPVAPSFLKTTSDMLNGDPVAVLRGIDKSKWADIRAGVNSDNLYTNFNNILQDMDALGYGQLVIPRGTSNIGTTLPVPSGVSVRGEGARATKIHFNGVTNGFRLNDYSEVHDLLIDGLNISQTGVHVDAASYTRVSNLRIQNLAFHGYAVTNATQTQAHNLSISNCQERGIIIDPHSSFNLVESAYCSGNTKAGLLIGHDSHHNIIRGIQIEQTGNAALWIHNASYKNEVIGLIIKGTTAGAGTPAILIGYSAQDNIVSQFIVEGYDTGVILRGAPADGGFTNGDTTTNKLVNGRIIGTGSGVAGSAGVIFSSADAGVTRCIRNKLIDLDISGFANGYWDPTGNAALDNVIQGGDVSLDVTTKYSLSGTSRTRLYNVFGYTPVGSLGGSTPAFPLTNVGVTNNFPFPVAVYIKDMPGTGTSTVQINGGDTGATLGPNGGNGTYILQPQQTITPFYGSGTPSWTWFGL
jgi:hypothetical protein